MTGNGTPVSDHQTRLRRLTMRCWRRGTREMDLVLGPFAEGELQTLDGPELDGLEALLDENDQDLYAWVTGRAAAPECHQAIVDRLRLFHKIG